MGSKLVDKQSHLGDNEYTAIGFVSQIRAIHPVFSISDNKVYEERWLQVCPAQNVWNGWLKKKSDSKLTKGNPVTI